jgi:hypothetical protein
MRTVIATNSRGSVTSLGANNMVNQVEARGVELGRVEEDREIYCVHSKGLW